MAAGKSRSSSKYKGYFLKRAYVLLTLLIVTLVAAMVAEPATLIFRIYFWPPRNSLPARPAPRDLADARRQDIADLRLLPEFDRSFSADAKAAFARGADLLDAAAGALSDAGFEMAVSRLVALAGNAHTTVDKTQRGALFGRAPLRFAWFADGTLCRAHHVAAWASRSAGVGDRRSPGRTGIGGFTPLYQRHRRTRARRQPAAARLSGLAASDLARYGRRASDGGLRRWRGRKSGGIAAGAGPVLIAPDHGYRARRGRWRLENGA